MFRDLALLNLPPSAPDPGGRPGRVFTLRTCQRLLVAASGPLAPDALRGHEAYRFLLETICGLKSRLAGEGEVAHQFKEAYRAMAASPSPDPLLMRILERLFQDSKKVRREHLMGIGVPTYAGVVRQIITRRVPSGPLAVVGSGRLAEGLVRIVRKRYDLRIAARDPARAEELRSRHGVGILPWDLRELAAFPLVVNTVGTREEIFPPGLGAAWRRANPGPRLMVCLGEPSPLPDGLRGEGEVLTLEDVLREGRGQRDSAKRKLDAAAEAVRELSRPHRLDSLPRGWPRRRAGATSPHGQAGAPSLHHRQQGGPPRPGSVPAR